ncbi:roadblock/LC7 domain-containing protein [Streptomyces sp. NPDC102360]|jgi:predicted regulator of Ras-like GTPase activity (Roadblock/LC7/MglB family)|uniref:roadblock/LC7 domain-containing protein n=1 Tax=Streptomyces sp. NPDC102360 TaxID=3366160 RepID=UPI0038019632
MTTQAPSEDLDWLLADFSARVPHVLGAVLASSDGVTRYRHGFDDAAADRLSAIATGMCSLGTGLSTIHQPMAGVEQVIVECAGGYLFVSKAGLNGVLGVLAAREAEVGVVGYEITMLVRSVRGHLGTPTRLSPAPSPDWAQ